MLTIGSLFSGIGGLELGLEWAGLGPVIWQVERDPACCEILAKHYPGAHRYGDIRTLRSSDLAAVDLICGGFPCQDVSHMGPREGVEAGRSGLWRHFARIVCDLRPRFVVVENVATLVDRGLGRILRDLASLGYDAEWSVLSACSVGAPHVRERLFVVAYLDQLDGWQGLGNLARETAHESRDYREGSEHWRKPLSDVLRVVDGIPRKLDRVRALGNAVVPQCAEVVGWVVRQVVEERMARV